MKLQLDDMYSGVGLPVPTSLLYPGEGVTSGELIIFPASVPPSVKCES